MLNENGEQINQQRDILYEIAGNTKRRVQIQKQMVSLETMRENACALPKGEFPFERALRQKSMAFICEVKKASPSKGLIAADFPYVEIAKAYEAAGAAAISCLTEPQYFQGENRYLQEISTAVSIPVLRKDFFVDEYMVYEAKTLGASAILLICAILDDETMMRFFNIAQALGLSAIFEAHDAQEVQRAVQCGARIIGVNNRNLKNFTLNLDNSLALRKLVPEDLLFISESGIRTREDIAVLEKSNINAVLIGETLMRAPNKKEMLNKLKGLS